MLKHSMVNLCRVYDQKAADSSDTPHAFEMATIVPTDERFADLDVTRPAMEFRRWDKGDWEPVWLIEKAGTVNQHKPFPSCFSLRQEVIEALEIASLIAEQTQHGVSSYKLTMED